ncbi:MAG: hypothetical protein ACI4VQ_02335 [Clostridia bacterium]
MDKEKVKEKFWEMIKNSWTYSKLTKNEKTKFETILFSEQTENCMKGTYTQKWRILQAIYHSFLIALDYKPIGWREEEESPLF